MESVVRACACAAAIVAAAALPPGRTLAGAPQGTRPFVFKSVAGLVTLNVTVQDVRSRYVTGLEPGDFAVFEDGVQQQVRFFESAAIPVDLIVLVDRSTSMSNTRAIVRDAARGLIETLRDCDRGAVLTFSRRVAIAQPFTHDRAALAAALDTGESSGFTALHGAVYVALKEFARDVTREDGVRRQVIAVLSDGEDTASLISFEDVVAAARQQGVGIYTIRLRSGDAAMSASLFGESELGARADHEMKQLARETGALAFFPSAPQLRGVYAAIGAEIASQYSIAYEPAVPLSNGGFRRVAVEVRGRPDLRVRTRAGYAARAGARGE